MNRLARRLVTLTAAAAIAAPALGLPMATSASASVPVVSAQAFGMHWLNSSAHSFPMMPFGSARIWDDGVTWSDLQPSGPTPNNDLLGLPDGTWTPAAWDPTALARLDNLVNTYVSHHVDPMITLGMTPAWAADTSGCSHVDSSGHDWGVQTCAPVSTAADGSDPWSVYVKFLAQRYQGKVHYFELWNEPSLRNGYNSPMSRLAQMQQQAQSILHGMGDSLVSPSIPFTEGPKSNPTSHGMQWLDQFLSQPGGTSFDVIGLHLYPSDAAVKNGVGPEWSIFKALGMSTAYGALKVLKAHGVAGRQVWATEMNIGCHLAHTGYTDTSAGAAAVARTFVLDTQYRVARTFWYAADERTWGGTWLENSSFTKLTTPGVAERTARNLIVGKAALGCTHPKVSSTGVARGAFMCRYGTTTGHRTLIAIWTTGSHFTYHAPAGTKAYYTVTGAKHAASKGKAFTITSTPVYLVGSFR